MSGGLSGRWVWISGFLTALGIVYHWVLVLAGFGGFALYAYWGGGRSDLMGGFLRGFYTGLGLMVAYWVLQMILPS